MTMMQTMHEWEDRVFDAVTRMDDRMVETSGRMAERFAEYTPERPAWSFLDTFPTVAELVDFNVGVAQRFVDTQGTFARGLVKAWEPVLAKFEPKPEVVPPVKRVRKAA